MPASLPVAQRVEFFSIFYYDFRFRRQPLPLTLTVPSLPSPRSYSLIAMTMNTSSLFRLKRLRSSLRTHCAGVSAVIALVITAIVPSAIAESRTWTASDGRKVEAEYLGYEGAGGSMQVLLKRADGQEFKFPYANLSEADQLFVRNSVPKDASATAREIDRLVDTKLEEAAIDIRKQGSELFARTDLDAKQKAKDVEELQRQIAMTEANPETSDEQFVRRIYLDVAGRIPTYDEYTRFMDTSSKNKRAELIDELLDSEAFVMHMFNWYSDLLRIRSSVSMNANQLMGISYIDWVKDSIRENKPYDVMVREMLTATGKIWDNPASGYLITDLGMPLCNLSNTFTVFLGTEITCAQCHDHPFEEVYQMDFYKMAAFMGGYDGRSRGGENSGQDNLARMNKLLLDGGKLRDGQKTDNGLGNIVGTFRYDVQDVGEAVAELPHDYKYDDASPNDKVKPGAYFGNIVDLEKFDTPREAFADWMASKENPRFTVNVVNRLWKRVFGLAQIEPVFNIPGHLDGQAQNYELLKYLEDTMRELDYDVKGFLRVLYNTRAYQREATRLTPSLVQIDNGTYHFPGPILRRMTAEQLWDSLVALTIPDADGARMRGWEDYKAVMETDFASIKTADDVLAFKERYSNVGGVGMGEMMGSTSVGGATMLRASEMQLPQRAGHFLREFGQSDKLLIENQYDTGSAPQVMALLNGDITNKTLTDQDSYLMKVAAGEGRGDRVEKIFISILGRLPTSDESGKAKAAAREGRDGEPPGYGDLIWALVNTREFMFIQ